MLRPLIVTKSKIKAVEQHMLKWKGCTLCPLHASARQKVFFAGRIPCDVLFIGEAPGNNEDDVGRPFVAQAGECLDQIIEESIDKYNGTKNRAILNFGLEQSKPVKGLSYCITNALLCHPPENRMPEREEIRACAGRLAEFVDLCNPKLVISVGKVAEIAVLCLLSKMEPFRTITIRHPGFILRQDNEQDREHERNRASSLILSTLRRMEL